MRIRAALVDAPGAPFAVRELDLEPPREDEILVRVKAVGICHTDLTMRRTWPKALTPMVFGHEGAGIVEAVGKAVTTVSPVDSVCLSYRSCATCPQCQAGHPAYCHRATLNTRGTRPDGTTPLSHNGSPVYGGFFGQSSFASHAIAYETNTVKLPQDLPFPLAAPLGCSAQTGAGTVLNVLDPAEDTPLAIFGAGSVGLTALMAAKSRNCPTYVVEPNPARRELALTLGATAALDPADVSTIRALPHYAIDTTANPKAINQAIAILRKRGTLALVGLGMPAEVDLTTVLYNGLTLHGVIEGEATPASFIPQLVELHRAGEFPVEKLVTEYRFEDIETAARDAAEGACIKPVLTFE